MRILLCLLLLVGLAHGQAFNPWFLGPDGGVYDGLSRVGLATGTSLAVVGDTAYLVGQDQGVWSGGLGGDWRPIDLLARGKKVAAASDGCVYLLGLDGGIYQLGAGRVGLGIGSDLAVGAGHDLFVVGTDGHIWKSSNADGAWFPYNGLAVARRVGAGPEGSVYCIGTDGGVYSVSSSNIQRLGLALAQEISVGPDGTPFIVGLDSAVYSYSGGSWRRLGNGIARQVVWPR